MMQSRRKDQLAARISPFPIYLDLADVLERLPRRGRKPGKIQLGDAAQSRNPKLAISGGGHIRVSAGAFFRQKAIGASELRVIDRIPLFALPASQTGSADASDASRSTGHPEVALDHVDISPVEGCNCYQ